MERCRHNCGCKGALGISNETRVRNEACKQPAPNGLALCRTAQHSICDTHTHIHTHIHTHANTHAHTQEGNSSDGEEKEEDAKEVFNETNGKNTNPLSPAKSGWKKPRGFRITNLAVRGREVRRQWFGERARQSCCATAPDHGMDKENDDAVQAIGGGGHERLHG